MSQILHIFRKDARRHWPEIAASLILVALYAWHEPANWHGETAFASDTFFLLQILWRFLPGLVFISWFLLIIRSVQSESLVGDRQFWITRPYEWWKLLAAKVLFVLAFVNAPYFIADAILLHRAGFSVFAHLSGLLEVQAVMAVTAFLVVATLATVTSGIGHLLLAALAVLLYLLSVGSLSDSIRDSGMTPGPLPATVIFFLMLGTCFFVICWQYARRRTLQSRIAIVAFLLSTLLISVATPYRWQIQRAYPLPQNGEEPLARFTPETLESQSEDSVRFLEGQKYVDLHLPLRASGLAQDLVVVRGLLVEVEGPDGFQADSHWRQEFTPLGLYGNRFEARFWLDKKAFDRAKSSSVKLRVSVALTAYKLQNRRTVSASAEPAFIPTLGECSIERSNKGVFQCLTAIRPPALLAQVDRSDLTCSVSGASAPPPPTAYWRSGDWTESSDFAPEIDPVGRMEIWFSTQDANGISLFWNICPGTPITLRTPRADRTSRTVFEVDGVHLPDLLVKTPTGLSR